jgi:hypothetical protein
LKVRSPALAALGLLLMAGAAVLGGLLVHDGEVDAAADLSSAAPGQAVSLKGEPAPFAPPASQDHAWRSVAALLDEHTYEMDGHDGAVVALLTSHASAPPGVVLAEGDVRYVGPHPDGSGRLLVVVAVHDWRQPIVFR